MDRRTKSESDGSSKNPICINIYNQQKDLPLSVPRLRGALFSLVSFLRISCKEFSLFFVSKRKICKLHEEFFQDPTLTDCISFPLDKEYLGDIFVCPAVAKEYVEKNGGEVYEEAMLYIVHALLHLLGYDDLDAQKRKVMRAKEKACMDHLRKSELLNL